MQKGIEKFGITCHYICDVMQTGQIQNAVEPDSTALLATIAPGRLLLQRLKLRLIVRLYLKCYGMYTVVRYETTEGDIKILMPFRLL